MRGGRAANAVVRRTGVPKQKSNKLYILRVRKENFFYLPASNLSTFLMVYPCWFCPETEPSGSMSCYKKKKRGLEQKSVSFPAQVDRNL